ncbi:MAG: hypothetical protein DWI59_01300 [Chloroflexi bacterium]|nr:MAG: hypothetical protein DWI59_01300 [Chloroflexota bacterium]
MVGVCAFRSAGAYACIGDDLMIPKTAPCGSRRMAKRPGMMSAGSCSTVAPRFRADVVAASVSATSKYTHHTFGIGHISGVFVIRPARCSPAGPSRM